MEVNYVDAAIDGAMSFGCSLLGSSITKNSVKTAENTISKGINRITSGIRGYNSHTGNYGRNLRRGLIFVQNGVRNLHIAQGKACIKCTIAGIETGCVRPKAGHYME